MNTKLVRGGNILKSRLAVIAAAAAVVFVTNQFVLEVNYPLSQSLIPVFYMVAMLTSKQKSFAAVSLTLMTEHIAWTFLLMILPMSVLITLSNALMTSVSSEWLQRSGWWTVFLGFVYYSGESLLFPDYQLTAPNTLTAKFLCAQICGFGLTILLTNFCVAIKVRSSVVVLIMSCVWNMLVLVFRIPMMYPLMTRGVSFLVILLRVGLYLLAVWTIPLLVSVRMLSEVIVGIPVGGLLVLFATILSICNTSIGFSNYRDPTIRNTLVGSQVVIVVLAIQFYKFASSLWLTTANAAVVNGFLLLFFSVPPLLPNDVTMFTLHRTPIFQKWFIMILIEIVFRLFWRSRDNLLSQTERFLCVCGLGHAVFLVVCAYVEQVKARSQALERRSQLQKQQHQENRLQPNRTGLPKDVGTSVPPTSLVVPSQTTKGLSSVVPHPNESNPVSKNNGKQELSFKQKVDSYPQNTPPSHNKPAKVKGESALNPFEEEEARRQAKREREKERKRKEREDKLHNPQPELVPARDVESCEDKQKGSNNNNSKPPVVPPIASGQGRTTKQPPVTSKEVQQRPPTRRVDETRARELIQQFELEKRMKSQPTCTSPQPEKENKRDHHPIIPPAPIGTSSKVTPSPTKSFLPSFLGGQCPPVAGGLGGLSDWKDEDPLSDSSIEHMETGAKNPPQPDQSDLAALFNHGVRGIQADGFESLFRLWGSER
eukprot:PhF_6_TR29255/c0_g1_i1/m.42837